MRQYFYNKRLRLMIIAPFFLPCSVYSALYMDYELDYILEALRDMIPKS